MPLPEGLPKKILKTFYQKNVMRKPLKKKADFENQIAYLLSLDFENDVVKLLSKKLTYKPKRYEDVDFDKDVKVKQLKDFFNLHFKLTAKEQKEQQLTRVINFALDGLDKAVEKKFEDSVELIESEALGIAELPTQQKQIDFRPELQIARQGHEDKKKLSPPPKDLIAQAQLNVKLDSRGVPEGANELIEGLTNFYLSQKLGNKASFLVQKDIQSLSFEDIELVINVDEAENDIFASERNQETIFNFIKKSKKDTVVIFVGIVFWHDYDADKVKGSHSNLLIYRKSKKSLERFEPDSTPVELDKSIDSAIKQVFELNDVKVKKYISPLNSCVRIQGLEEMENQKRIVMKKLSDESKESVSCFFWNVLYLQNRLDDLDSTQDEVVGDIVDAIKEQTGSFAKFIKDYSTKLIRLLDEFRRMNPNNKNRRNYCFGREAYRMNVEGEKLDRKTLIKKSSRELNEIALSLGITNEELRDKSKKQRITMILDRQAGFVRPEEELDLEVDADEPILSQLIDDIIEGKINPRRDGKKIQDAFDKIDKKEGEKSFFHKIARIQQRIDIAFVTAIGLGDITVAGKKLGDPKAYGQPPFTKTEKSVIAIVKKLNPLGLLSETDALKKGLNFLKAFFGRGSSTPSQVRPRPDFDRPGLDLAGEADEEADAAPAPRPRRPRRPRQGTEDDFLRGDYKPGFSGVGTIDVPFLRNPFKRTGLIDVLDVEKLLSGKVLKVFQEQSDELKEEILEDAKNLIEQLTDFTFQNAPSNIKRRFLVDAIGFIVFGE